MTDNALQLAADKLGLEHGHNAAHGLSTATRRIETKRAIIKGYDDGDPEIMDMQPSPLSGEWSDDPTVADILESILESIADLAGFDLPEIFEPDDISSDLLDRYETAHADAFWAEVIRSAAATLSDNEENEE